MDLNDDLNKNEDPEPQPERVESFRVYSSSGSDLNLPFKAKLIFWGTVAVGIAVGTFLFLFFLSLFIYAFLPLAALLLLYQWTRRFLRK